VYVYVLQLSIVRILSENFDVESGHCCFETRVATPDTTLVEASPDRRHPALLTTGI